MLKKFEQKTFLQILILIFVSVLTFLPTLQMLFYLDEWGNMYDFTHKPYGFTVFTAHTFYMLYRLFGIDPTGYFGTGIIFFALSVVAFYFLARSLFKNKLLGFIAALIYATTPVGTNTTQMVWTYVVEGGYPFNLMLILLLLSLLKFFKKPRTMVYTLILIGFCLFLEFEPRRAFIILPILILFDYVINVRRLLPTKGFIFRTLLLFIGFILYYKYYFTMSGLIGGEVTFVPVSAGSYDGLAKFNLGVSSLTHIKPQVTFMNIFLGGPWVFISEKLSPYINVGEPSQVYALVFVVLAIVLGILVLTWKTKKQLLPLLIFSLGWIYINIFGIYIFSSPGISETVHRTLSIAAPGYALFFTTVGLVLYSFLKKQKRFSTSINKFFAVSLILLISVNFLATWYNMEKFNSFRSRPAKKFFKDLKSFYPTLPKDSLLYFKTPDNTRITYGLTRIFGGSPYGAGSSITVYYPYLTLKDIIITREMVDVQKFIASDSGRINRVYSFYYDQHGISDKTTETRKELKSSASAKIKPSL